MINNEENKETSSKNSRAHLRGKLQNVTPTSNNPEIEVEETETTSFDLKSMRSEMKKEKEAAGENFEITTNGEDFVFEHLQAEIESNNAEKIEEVEPKNLASEEEKIQKEQEREELMKKFFPDGTYNEDEEKAVMTVDELKEQKKEDVIVKKKKKNNKILLILVAVIPTAVLLFVVIILASMLLNEPTQNNTGSTGNGTIPSELSKDEINAGAELSVSEAQAILENAKKETDLMTVELDEEGNPTQTISSNIVDESKLSTDAFNLTKIDDGRISETDSGTFSFSDPSAGISLTYPGAWNEVYGFTSKEKPNNVNNVVLIGSDPSINKADNMRISIEATPKTVSAKEYFNETVDLFAKNFDEYQLISSGEKTIAGGEAMYRVYSWATMSTVDSPIKSSKDRVTQYQIYISGKEKMFVITFTAKSDKFDRNFKKYEQILSSVNVNRR